MHPLLNEITSKNIWLIQSDAETFRNPDRIPDAGYKPAFFVDCSGKICRIRWFHSILFALYDVMTGTRLLNEARRAQAVQTAMLQTLQNVNSYLTQLQETNQQVTQRHLVVLPTSVVNSHLRQRQVAQLGQIPFTVDRMNYLPESSRNELERLKNEIQDKFQRVMRIHRIPLTVLLNHHLINTNFR